MSKEDKTNPKGKETGEITKQQKRKNQRPGDSGRSGRSRITSFCKKGYFRITNIRPVSQIRGIPFLALLHNISSPEVKTGGILFLAN